jgi:multiple antibiotic resistance protein
LIAFTFLFIGEPFLKILNIQSYALSICGGILLVIVAIEMIFPPTEVQSAHQKTYKEPYIVPIATPLITGGGVLSTVMIYAEKEQNNLKMVSAIVVAWIAVTCVVVSAAYLQKILGKKGLLAMEQLMGMMLALLSSQLIVNGIVIFVTGLQKG